MKPLLAPLALFALAACAAAEDANDDGSFCFPVEQEDLGPMTGDQYQGQQLVCSLDRVDPGAREKYIERHPELRRQANGPAT